MAIKAKLPNEKNGKMTQMPNNPNCQLPQMPTDANFQNCQWPITDGHIAKWPK